MRSETTAMIERLKRVKWFSNCGQYEGEEFVKIISKSEALSRFTSRKWFAFANPIRNREMSFVVSTFDSIEDYNAIAKEVCGSAAEGLVVYLDAIIVERFGGDPKISEAFRMDLAWTLWETEFSHIFKPIFYLPKILRIYEMGYLPCGWEGVAPSLNWAGNSPLDLPPGRVCIF